MTAKHSPEDSGGAALALASARPQAEPPIAWPEELRQFQTEAWVHWLMLGLAGSVLAAAACLQIRGHSQVIIPWVNVPLPPMCQFQALFGIDCPGCGLTRCFISLAHGDLGGAWRYNPAGMLFFGVVAAQLPYRLVQLWRIRQGLPQFDCNLVAARVLLAFALALLLQWVIRMLW